VSLNGSCVEFLIVFFLSDFFPLLARGCRLSDFQNPITSKLKRSSLMVRLEMKLNKNKNISMPII
jgi:hypothetical protein